MTRPPEKLLSIWSRVLTALNHCNLRLSAAKTVICPKSTTILGWIWNQGTLSASPHRIAVLSSCPPPSTVKGLRSFIGAYKVLGRVLSGGVGSVVRPLPPTLKVPGSIPGPAKSGIFGDLHSH